MNSDNPATLAATVNWLEVEQREGKDQLHRLQQLVEQMHSILQDHAFRLQSTEETVEAMKALSSRLPALEEDLRQTKERTGQIQETQNDVTRALERLERTKKSEEESTREAIRGLTRSLEELGASAESLTERNRSLEGALKRQQEQLDRLKGQQEELRKSLESLAQAQSFSQEQSRRAQERAEQLALEMDPLRRQDEVIQTKLEVAGHQAKQMDQRLEALNAETQARRDLPERLDLQRVGLERVERQVLQALQLIEKLSGALEKRGQHLRDVEGRAKNLLDQVLRLQQRSQEAQTRQDEVLLALGEMLEQDKRRQIAELEGQIRGLKERLARLRGASLAPPSEAP